MADELLNALGRLAREQRAAADADPRTGPLTADERDDLLAGVLARLQASGPAATSPQDPIAPPKLHSETSLQDPVIAPPHSETSLRGPAIAPLHSTATSLQDPAIGPAPPPSETSLQDPAIALHATATSLRDPAIAPLSADAPAPLASEPSPPPTNLVELAPRRRARWFAGLGSLAAAAALALVLLRGGGEPSLDLPAYALVRGGDATSRSHAPSAPSLRLRVDSPVDLVLAPATPVTGPVEVRLVASQAGTARWLVPDATVSADGAIRLRGTAAWGLPAGRWQLAVLVGRPDRLPADLAAWQAATTPDWQVLALELEVVGAD